MWKSKLSIKTLFAKYFALKFYTWCPIADQPCRYPGSFAIFLEIALKVDHAPGLPGMRWLAAEQRHSDGWSPTQLFDFNAAANLHIFLFKDSF